MSPELTHIDEHGRASMVDVSHKATTFRQAWARCRVIGAAPVLAAASGGTPEWTLLEAARCAGIAGAKSTAHLIPLCHPLPLTGIEIDFEVEEADLVVSARSETVAQTGVEMEALTACAAAALTIMSAVKGVDPLVHLEELTLWEKRGGRSGIWRRQAE